MNEEEVRQALASVEDPEAGMSIVELGLVYSIGTEPGHVHVAMTMTSPASTCWRSRAARQSSSRSKTRAGPTC